MIASCVSFAPEQVVALGKQVLAITLKNLEWVFLGHRKTDGIGLGIHHSHSYCFIGSGSVGSIENLER